MPIQSATGLLPHLIYKHADIYLCYQRFLPRHDPSDTTTCDVLLSHVPQLVPVTQVDVKGTPLVLYRPRK